MNKTLSLYPSLRVAASAVAFVLATASAVAQTAPRPASAGSAATSPAAPQPIAQVNGKSIMPNMFDMALQDQIRAGAQDSLALREAVRRDLVIQTVLVDLAEKTRLDRNPATELRVAAARNAVLAQAWQQQWLSANPPTEDEIQAEYETIKQRTGNKEYQIRQVVLRDETAAKLVLEQIRRGKTLAEMAAEYSIEPLGKENGGLMPWVTANNLVEPLNQLVVTSVGKRLPEPVRTAGGFHIVEVIAERPFNFPTLEQIRPQIAQAVAQRKLSAAVQEQVNAARIELR